ncbi:uncharacterized protein V6R79_019169 [Siganus canaliculatus]
MAPLSSTKRWTLCAVSLLCFAHFTTSKQDGPLPELFIFNELCALKNDAGPCRASLPRFFFNVDSGLCELFEYGGCGGNDNNFISQEACEETCVVSDDKNPCHLPKAAGPCRGLLRRYVFDTETQRCQSFFYGGCFGNANNFKSMAQCEAKCPRPVSSTEAPKVHVQSGRHSDDVELAVLAEIIPLNEAQTQANETKPERKETKPTALCFSPMDPGTCQDTEHRFAYNPMTKRCQGFNYTGCGGNENNFKYRKDCIRKCIGIRKAHGKKMIRVRKKNLEKIVNRSG